MTGLSGRRRPIGRRTATGRVRFDGAIYGVGTESGTRLVVGAWSASPFGAFVDVMVESADGRRTLIAPRDDVADFITAMYTFEEVRVEPTSSRRAGDRLTVRSPSLTLELDVGRRTGVGRLLRLVPAPLRRARWWCRAIGPLARRLRPGVRTVGTVGPVGAVGPVGTVGPRRREYYCAADEHLIRSVRAVFDGTELGVLRPVRPAVRFGFASAPPTPSRVRVTTLIDRLDRLDRRPAEGSG